MIKLLAFMLNIWNLLNRNNTTRSHFYFFLLYIELVENFIIFFQIKVIVGDDRETTGHLLSIDGLEGVVKTDSNDIKLYHLSHLCKLSG